MFKPHSIGEFFSRYYKVCISIGIVLAIASAFAIPNLQFSFTFEQFFPEDDPDLRFYKKYIEKFESDDKFLMIAVENKPSIYDESFLKKFKNAVDSFQNVENVKNVRALVNMQLPVLNPITGIEFENPLQINNSPYVQDSIRISKDQRIQGRLITDDKTALITYLETVENIDLHQSEQLMNDVHEVLSEFDRDDYHIMGRAFFQDAIPEFQAYELAKISLISALLILIITSLVFRRVVPVAITLSTISLGLMVFMGFMWVSGQSLNFMAAIYPLLMIIVGTSDIIHIMTKYLKELDKGKSNEEAIGITLNQIGMATFLTSITTAAGFASLFTSKLNTIQQFGMNAAIGVFIAFVISIFFSASLLYICRPSQLLRKNKGAKEKWSRFLYRFYKFTIKYQNAIIIFSVTSVIMLIFGVSKISTNTELSYILPQGERITKDFNWFEQNVAGFRPLEYAAMPQDTYSMEDPEVLFAVNDLENHLSTYEVVEDVSSQTILYKSLNRLMEGNKAEDYKMPSDPDEIRKMQPFIDELRGNSQSDIFASDDGQMGRISGRIMDVGTDSFHNVQNQVNHWISLNIDSSVVQFRSTGTGVIFDKNAAYVRSSLINGLILALIIVSVLLALLFRSFKMILISIIPNLIPLLFAGAMMSLFNIQLEAGATIVFAVIFGLAVDDTIHFISKYKLAFRQYGDSEKALEVTFEETGHALFITSLILFAGFCVLLFSQHLPTRVVGMLISTTIVSALFYDLLLIPVLIRLIKPDPKRKDE